MTAQDYYKKRTTQKMSKTTKTKILLFDIETSPNLAYVWGKYEQDVIAYDREWCMLSFAYKWLGEKTVHAYALSDFKGYNKHLFDDKALVTKLHALMNEADVIIGHNSDSFDIKKTNARLIANGLPPPAPYKTIDTKKVAKRYFNFNSNKLSDLGIYLGLGDKLDTGGFKLWLGCMKGDAASWKKMVLYNKQDVLLLEDVYLTMLPWITNHPNRALIEGIDLACPNCSAEALIRRGFGYNRTSKYQRLQCTSCGAWSSDRKLIRSKVIAR
jgi:DNA polymerase elongation subunit (family B)